MKRRVSKQILQTFVHPPPATDEHWEAAPVDMLTMLFTGMPEGLHKVRGPSVSYINV